MALPSNFDDRSCFCTGNYLKISIPFIFISFKTLFIVHGEYGPIIYLNMLFLTTDFLRAYFEQDDTLDCNWYKEIYKNQVIWHKEMNSLTGEIWYCM